jgi:hypothetical protein
MKERFFLDRVHIEGDRTAVDECVKLPLPVLPHPTDPPLGRRDDTSMIAKNTLYLPIL